MPATRTEKTPKPRTSSTTLSKPEETPVGHKSCAYPSCSARGTKEYGANNVPGCAVHGPIFETQSQDGAGIQQLMENYRG